MRNPERPGTGDRLWRARRRHDRIDAVLGQRGRYWLLRFFRNGRLLLSRRHETEALARAEAGARLKELQRAGWNTHW
ncbi:MAG TPA: hypothetical protein VD833_18865 [Vicinamibacterales bacterium]|nr:hypothetical protein [Vicinamibacterales bacterium]